MSNLKIVFMGTPDFAVASLNALVQNNFNIVGVITAPDKPAGRGQKLQQSAVKQYAEAKGLTTLQPAKLKDEAFLEQLKSLQADIQIVVAFRMLPEVVWNMPRLGSFNLHGSLLPHYRGAAPINWAVMNGEKETGVSTFFLQQEIDTGKIIFQERTPIGENETTGDVHDRLMIMGATLVVKTIKAIETGNYPQIDQQTLLAANEESKEAPKIFKPDCKIDWTQPINTIHNKIRGLSPYPTAFTEFIDPDGNLHSVKLFMSTIEIIAHSNPLYYIYTDNKTYLKIAVKEGYIVLSDLQIAGKKRMPTTAFLRGFHIDNKWKIL
jgi:methionyl-tRNA formyltransferase